MLPIRRTLLNVALAIAAIAPLACTIAPEATAPPQSSTPGEIEDLPQSAFRFRELPGGDLVTYDPLLFTQDRFGPWEPTGSNYGQDLQVIVGTPEQRVILYSQWGLSDDSVAGIRTRLDFMPASEDQWELVWVGQQFICHPGRGQQDWAMDLCS